MRGRGLIRLQERHSCFAGVSALPAAVPQVANAFHVAPTKRGTAVDVRRKCVTDRKPGPYSNRQIPPMNRSQDCPNSRPFCCRSGGSRSGSMRGASLLAKGISPNPAGQACRDVAVVLGRNWTHPLWLSAPGRTVVPTIDCFVRRADSAQGLGQNLVKLGAGGFGWSSSVCWYSWMTFM